MYKKILLTVLFTTLCTALFSTFFWALSADALALTLDESLRPENLPGVEIMDATSDTNPETAATQTLIVYVGSLVSKFLLFAGAISIVFMIIAGANYIFAFGKDERIERGKRGMFWSVAGLLIIMLSYAIIQGIISLILQVDG